MRELNVSEIQSVSGGYGTLGPGGGSDPGNQLNDYGVDAGGLRYTPESTRKNIATTGGGLVFSPYKALQTIGFASTVFGSWR